VDAEARRYPCNLSTISLLEMFMETGSFVAYSEQPAASDNYDSHAALHAAIVEELFSRRDRKRPSCMALGMITRRSSTLALPHVSVGR
jgi:hypothetical protein